MISVPVLTPRLSSLWLGLVTPVYARIGRKLIDSIQHPTVVRDKTALDTFAIRPMGIRRAIARALRNEDQAFAETRWSDALSSGGTQRTWGGVRFGTRIVDSRTAEVPLPPAVAFTPIRRIGGATGWYYANFLWSVRGFIDLLVGGVGSRRGRRDPEWLCPGETVDFWRVEAVEPDRRSPGSVIGIKMAITPPVSPVELVDESVNQNEFKRTTKPILGQLAILGYPSKAGQFSVGQVL
jgi:hypothetical protein